VPEVPEPGEETKVDVSYVLRNLRVCDHCYDAISKSSEEPPVAVAEPGTQSKQEFQNAVLLASTLTV